MPSRFGLHEVDDVREGRLGEHDRDVARRQRRLEPGGIVELGDPHPAGDGPAEAALLGHRHAVLEVDQAFVEVSVVVPAEQQDDLAAGHGPGQTDRFGVRLGRRQRELPVGLSRVPPCELLRDQDRFLGRQQELRRAGRPLLHRADDRRIRVAAERRQVARVEVEVVEPSTSVNDAPSPPSM